LSGSWPSRQTAGLHDRALRSRRRAGPEAAEEAKEPDIDQVAQEAAIERGEISADELAEKAKSTEEPAPEPEEPVATEETTDTPAEDTAEPEQPAEKESVPEAEKKEEGQE